MPFTTHQLVIFAARSGNIASCAIASELEAMSARLQAIEWLIANGADVNAEYSDQIGPLEIALRHPDPEVVGVLLQAGARLRKRARPYYTARLEACVKALGHAPDSGDHKN